MPSRSGADTVLELARAIEDVGYDEIALFEHVTVGHPIPGRSETRQAAPGAAGAPGDAWRDLVQLRGGSGSAPGCWSAAATPAGARGQTGGHARRALRGRVRLGVGVGWQRSEYESLGVPFAERGRRIDEAITLMRRYWTEPSVTFRGHFYRAEAMGMDPKPVQPAGPPLWLGGDSEATCVEWDA